MADARLKAEWLGQIKFDGLSDEAWRVFTHGLQWCVDNETDGFVDDRFVHRLHPDGTRKHAAYAEMEDAGLWSKVDGGYQFEDWRGYLGQSTAAEIRDYKEKARERSRKSRERKKQAQASTDTGEGPAGPRSDAVTRDVQENVRPHVREHVGTGTGTGAGSRSTQPSLNSDAASEIADDDPFTSPSAARDVWEVQSDGSRLNLRSGEVRRRA